MESSITQENSDYQIGLNIHLLSFGLPKKLIRDYDSVRVNIITLPDENKQHFIVKGQKMNYSNHIFSLNITNKTEKIVMEYRKKSLLNESPVIATNTIILKKFVKLPIKEITNGTKMSEIKKIDIYVPNQKQENDSNNEKNESNTQNNQSEKKKIIRKVLGDMEVQLSFTAPFLNLDSNENAKKKKKTSKKCKQTTEEEYGQLNEEHKCFTYTLV